MTNLFSSTRRTITVLFLFTFIISSPNAANTATVNSGLLDLSLEELLDINITTLSKETVPLKDAPASVFILTSEDIKRSGAKTLHDSLRLVPGLTVANITGNTWAISARGFIDIWANKLLVMVDGRSTYTPLYSGTNWDELNLYLDDIERIEVIKGPGTAIWGANAVNGIINIITKHSSDTVGVRGYVATGNYNNNDGAISFGSKIGDSTYGRAYVKFFDSNDNEDLSGTFDNGLEARDRFKDLRGGFRLDTSLAGGNTLMLTGEVYEIVSESLSTSLSLVAPPTNEEFINHHRGSNLNLKWSKTISPDSGFYIQTYYNERNREAYGADRKISTFDFDFNHFFNITPSNRITWGAGYRNDKDRIEDSFSVSFDPNENSNYLLSYFLQDELSIGNTFNLSLGIKVEDNEYSGSDTYPSLRALWKISDNHSLWAGATRSIRQVSRSHSDIRINIYTIPFLLRIGSIYGTDSYRPEEVTSYELGYRGASKSLSFDISTFYSEYDYLTTSEQGLPFPDPDNPGFLVIPIYFENLMYGETYGAEAVLTIKPSNNWKLRLGYSINKMALHLREESQSADPSGISRDEIYEDTSPDQQVFANLFINITDSLSFDILAYYMDSLPYLNIPSYTKIDARIGWRPNDNVEVSIAGHNLTDPGHIEFETSELYSTEVPRIVYGKISFKY